MKNHKSIQKAVRALAPYYRDIFSRHGTSYAGVDMPKIQDAELRYHLHWRALEGRGVRSILDVGCGPGLFYRFSRQRYAQPFKTISYEGVDSNRAMIRAAQEAFPKVRFKVASLEAGLRGIAAADFVIANGVFTLKAHATRKDMWAFIERALEVMWHKARVGMSFNFMTSHVDYRYSRLLYADPAKVIQTLVPKFGRRFAVLHDTRLFDSVYVWLKDPKGLWGQFVKVDRAERRIPGTL